MVELEGMDIPSTFLFAICSGDHVKVNINFTQNVSIAFTSFGWCDLHPQS